MKYDDCHSIKDVRKKCGLNQAHMAYLLGVSIRKYRDMEKGISCFSQYDMIKIMLVFSLTKDDIYNIFFSKENNKFLYSANNLNSFNKDVFIEDFNDFCKNNKVLFHPWQKNK